MPKSHDFTVLYSDVQEFEDAISETGFGLFNLMLLLLSTAATAAIIFESTTLSYVMPAAETDLKLTITDKGHLYGITYAGMITSAIPWAVLSDTRGRKLVLVLSHCFDAIFVLLSACSQSFVQLLIFRFLGGFSICGGYPTVMTYLAEMHGKIHRARIIFFLGILLTLAAITMTLLAMAILPVRLNYALGDFKFHSWNVLIAVSAIPSIICAISFAFLPETPKYLMSKNDVVRAHQVFATMFAMNKRRPRNEYPVQVSSLRIRGDVLPITYSLKKIFKEGWKQTKPVFSPTYRYKALNICVVDFLVLMCQNTLRLWMPQLFATAHAISKTDEHHDSATICNILESYRQENSTSLNTELTVQSFANNLIVGGVSAIAYIFAIVIIPRVGPKVVLTSSLGAASVAGYAMLLATSEVKIVLTSALYMSVENISATSVVNACVSVFPTEMRNTIVSSAMLAGRVGSLIGNCVFPRLIAMGCLPPILWMGTLSLVAFIISLLLPNPAAAFFQ